MFRVGDVEIPTGRTDMFLIVSDDLCRTPIAMDAETKDRVSKLLNQHKAVLTGELGCVNNYTHKIDMTTSEPPKARSYPIPREHCDRVAAMLREMERLGVVEKRLRGYGFSGQTGCS